MTIRSIINAMPLPLFEAEGASAGAGADKGAGAGEGDKGADKSGAGGEKMRTAMEGGGDEKAGDKGDDKGAPDPEAWRKDISGGNKDVAKLLERYKSPADIGKTLAEQTRLLSKGLRDVPMPDAEKDPEAAKAWREERGIPESSDKYEIVDEVKKLIDDADKPIVDGALDHFHKLGYNNKQMNDMLGFYFGLEQATLADQEKVDKDNATAAKAAMRDLWGGRYEDQKTLAEQFANEAIEGAGVNLFHARLPADPAYGKYAGMLLGDIPEIAVLFARLGEKEYGDSAYAGSEAATKTANRKEEIEKVMRTDMRKYRGDKKMQAEYRQIMEAEQRRGVGR